MAYLSWLWGYTVCIKEQGSNLESYSVRILTFLMWGWFLCAPVPNIDLVGERFRLLILGE